MGIVELVDFEGDLQSLAERVENDETFAHDLYGALCNTRWVHAGSDVPYSFTWRAASELVADMRGTPDLFEYYCAGGEGAVSEDVAYALERLGWTPLAWDWAS